MSRSNSAHRNRQRKELFPITNRDIASIVSTTQAYYDGPADEIYRSIWGDNIHLGVYCGEERQQLEAKQHTNELMADAVTLGPDLRVLDLGCGYGHPPATWPPTSVAA